MRRLQVKFVLNLIKTSVIPLLAVGALSLYAIHQMGLSEARQTILFALDRQTSIYERAGDKLKDTIWETRRRISNLLEEDQIDLMKNEFMGFFKKNKLDFFVVTDQWGKIIFCASNPGAEGSSIGDDPLFKSALHLEKAVSTEVAEAAELARFGLDGQAPVRNPAPRALLMKASIPIINHNEIVIGTIQGGYLLNKAYSQILDPVKQQTGLNPSIFLGNTRIASTIPVESGMEPIGRVMDIPGTRDVLGEGVTHFGRVNVVRTHHQAGYTPIRDSAGRIIGMHGIGMPEAKIFALRNRLVFFFALALLAAIALSLFFGLKGGARVVESIRKLRKGIEAFGREDLLYRVHIDSGDELEELGDFFNLTMAHLLAAKKQLEAYSSDIGRLENTVAQSSRELAQTQKKLLEFERMAAMGRMATALSHELRNTFAELSAGIYALKQQLARSEPELQATVDELKISLDHATETLSNVLRFSYPKKPVMSTVDLNYLLDDLLSQAATREMFRKYGIRAEKSVQGHIPQITADGLQLREMFVNIVTNGVQAMEHGGKISLLLRAEEGNISVSIGDTGPGIPEDTMKQLFTPFFTTKSRGLGLGLCISKTIAEEHGGAIEVMSKPGKGTTFVITIPAVKQGAGI